MDVVVLSGSDVSPTVFMTYGSKGYLFDFKLAEVKGQEYEDEEEISLRVPAVDDIGIENVDYVLLSTFESYTALPYLIHNSKFHGKVCASVPTIDLGRVVLMNLSRTLSRDNITGKNRFTVLMNDSWVPIYNEHAIEECMSKIIPVKYMEIMKIDKSTEICPASSGYCIGGTNWIIRTPEQKVVYMSISSDTPQAPPAALDTDSLIGADFLFAPNLPYYIRTPVDEVIRNMGVAISNTFARNGSVLIPVNVVENVYELISIINLCLTFSGYSHIPIHFVSSVAKISLHTPNVLGEWMSSEYQKKVYDMKYPLIHGQLVTDKLLYHHEHPYQVFGYQKPYIIMAGHVGFRFGEAIDLLKIFSRNNDNLVILPDCPESAFNSFTNINTFSLMTRSSLNIAEIVDRVRPKLFACIDNPQNRSHAHSLALKTRFVPISRPVKFDLKQKFVTALLTEKSLKFMEVNDSSFITCSDGNKLYPLIFSGNVMIPSSLKTPDPGISFVVRVKTNNDQSQNEAKTFSSDELVTKYLSHIPDVSIQVFDTPNIKIISWKENSNTVSLKTNDLQQIEALVSSSSPHILNKLNKVIDDYICEKK